MSHEPSLDKLPPVLRGLPWERPEPSKLWEDGDRYLFAAPVCHKPQEPDGAWSYDIAVGVIACDEHYFSIEVDDTPWAWQIEDVDFCCKL